MVVDDGLAQLMEDGIIDAVRSRLMSGKEATVFVVERAGAYGAAKVYKARDDRTFKKTASYVEGRNQTRNSRDRRAMHKKSAYGRDLSEEGWKEMEYQALRLAFDAGVRVPEPYNLYGNILLMELLLDEQGAPASRMADIQFTPEEANRLHLEVFMQVKALLAIGRIHGDLSAYNVLMAAGGPTLIDMPQVVEVAGNNNARQILRRDLRNVTEFLARFDARLLRFADCGDPLFVHLMRGTLDTVTGPEIGTVRVQGGGHRDRDAARGKVGREKGHRPQGSGVTRNQGGQGGANRGGSGGPSIPRGGDSVGGGASGRRTRRFR
jgi:RIO kinase 1